MWTLGINWNFHDSSAAIVDGSGIVLAMSEEERFTRVKHAWGDFPVRATRFCLDRVGISWRDLDVVAVGWDMNLYEPWPDDKTPELFRTLFGEQGTVDRWPELVFVNHHLAHAAVSFYGSGLREAAVLVMDGSGERSSISIFRGEHGKGLDLQRAWGRTNSLGALYEATTRALGFGNLAAGKVMGLAPYATDFVDDLITVESLLAETRECPPGFAADADPEDEECVATWLRYFEERFGMPSCPVDRIVEDPVALRLAGSAQRAIETAAVGLHAEARRLAGVDAVCLSGGVSLNCVANGMLPEPLFAPPIPHDAGVALGAAWFVSPPAEPRVLSPYLGTDIDERSTLSDTTGLCVRPFDPAEVAAMLADGALGAVAEGRAEVGPRALGHRSIVAVPSPARVLTDLNRRKGREAWRPLAPFARKADAGQFWPDQGTRAKYMTGSVQVHEEARTVLPAATHIDGSSRPQAIDRDDAPVVESVLAAIEAGGLPPVLINTSFNGRGEPIVDNADDAVSTFRRLGLDFAVIGGRLLTPTE